MGEAKKRREIFGATNDFPRGKLMEGDEGGLNIGVTVIDKTLIINFGPKPVEWIGLSRLEVMQLINILLERLKDI